MGQTININIGGTKKAEHANFKPDKMTININPKSTRPFNELLVHELSHTVLFISGLSAAIDNPAMEEAICTAMEHGLGPAIEIEDDDTH
jgi:hypothetical protein